MTKSYLHCHFIAITELTQWTDVKPTVKFLKAKWNATDPRMQEEILELLLLLAVYLNNKPES